MFDRTVESGRVGDEYLFLLWLCLACYPFGQTCRMLRVAWRPLQLFSVATCIFGLCYPVSAQQIPPVSAPTNGVIRTFFLQRGQVFTVTTIGKMNQHKGECPATGEGGDCTVSPAERPWIVCEKSDGTVFNAHGLACWSLIGAIGKGSTPQIGVSLKGFVADWTGELLLGVNDNRFNDQGGGWLVSASIGCGDGRDQMALEYLTYDVLLRPKCTDFVDSGHSNYFSFADLNVACPSQAPAKYSWALVRSPLLEGIDPWVESYKAIITSKYGRPYKPRIINSAYRVPSQNKACGGAPNSRHMYGDAADMRNITRTNDEWQAMRQAAQGNASWIEPLSGPCRLACVHADWRDQ
jgi:hypothetical protein